MLKKESRVYTIDELLMALADPNVIDVVVAEHIAGSPSIRLPPGQSLRGASDRISLTFADGADGIQLSTDNQVGSIHLKGEAHRRVIFNDTSVNSLGRIVIKDVATHGRVQILARDKVRGGHVEIQGLDIISADARAEIDRPHEYGVYVLQGAFTLWNMQKDEDVVITADLIGLSAGRPGAPVRGSGIFVSGAGDAGGRLSIKTLETAAVYSDGGIKPGTADQITGGVFTVYGAHVDAVRNLGPVVTYGSNDMVLDNWGVVDRWTADEKITSYGSSAIGFVNFGVIRELKVNAPLETFGAGSRGFNVYTGTVHLAEFDRVVTHADGAVGVQISQPIGKLIVRRGIETFGGAGDSLVKGVMLELSAIALSIKPGGSAREIEITGGVRTNGAGIIPIEQHGSINSLHVSGGFVAPSSGFDTI